MLLKHLRNTGIFAAILLIPLILKSQQESPFFFKQLTTENIQFARGLSQNSVYTILQDHQGFLWFGTWDGLNKYDGYNFQVFNTANGLSNVTINCLFEDPHQNLWIGTEHGLNVMDINSSEIYRVYYDPDDPNSISSNWINNIYFSLDSSLYILTDKGVNRFDHSIGGFRRFLDTTATHFFESNNILQFLQDTNGNYWAATQYGLVFYEIKNKVTTRFYADSKLPNSLPDNHIKCLCFDEALNLWIGTRNGLSRKNKSTNSFTNYVNDPELPNSLPGNHINKILLDSRNRLWVATNQGLCMYRKDTDDFLVIRSREGDLNSLSNNQVLSLYEDKQGVIWVGTFAGVNKINPAGPRFQLFRSNQKNSRSLTNNLIWDFFEADDGSIWIATDDGINVINKDQELKRTIQHEKDQPNSLASNAVRNIYKDSKGNIWFGYRDKGASVYNPHDDSFIHFEPDPTDANRLTAAYVVEVTEDSLGRIWMATSNGLNLYEPLRRKFTQYLHDPNEPGSIIDNKIYDLHLDSRGRLWLSSNGGLMRLNYQKDSFEHITLEKDGILFNSILSIGDAGNELLWLGTRGSGLIIFDPNQPNDFEYFTEEDGLANNIVYAALRDSKGDFWITTNYGMSHLNMSTRRFNNYDVSDGLQSNEFNHHAYLVDSDSLFYIGGMNGYNTFRPDEVIQNNRPPPIRITSFNVFEKPRAGRYLDGDTIILHHTDNYFSIEFTALDYINPTKNSYAYMLHGYDQQWNKRKATQRIAQYTHVPAGMYRFQVKGSNSDGIWNEAGVELFIEIKPAWWNTWWFRSIFLVLIVSTVYALISRRIKFIKKQHQQEKQLMDIRQQINILEQKALQLQMNPHFIFNTLNSIQAFVMKKDTDAAVFYLGKFSRLMRQVLGNSRKKRIPLGDELGALKLYIEIEQFRLDKKFTFDLVQDPDVDDQYYEIPPMLLQPFVENAILHGLLHLEDKAGKLIIHTSLEENTLICTIEDNGIGRQAAQEKKKMKGLNNPSRGLQITRERIEALNHESQEHYELIINDLYNSHGAAEGTRVEVRIDFKDH